MAMSLVSAQKFHVHCTCRAQIINGTALNSQQFQLEVTGPLVGVAIDSRVVRERFAAEENRKSCFFRLALSYSADKLHVISARKSLPSWGGKTND